jgi:diadenosine tetraphosphate (Ap4A) HIT family hydrolase
MMVDAHLHFHVLPRYSKEQTFNNVSFIDKGWPKLPELTAPAYEKIILNQIKELLKNSI